jgi:peptide/nickel transport system substrate-binding protein
MQRRHLLQAGAAGLTTLAMPAIARGAAGKVLKFIPDSDLTIVDPIVSVAYVARIHALMVYDTLYGQDDAFNVQLQMLEGQQVEDGGLTWRLTLRDGLRFHDGEPVMARDVVASLQRWGRVNTLGQTLMAVTDELSAPSDREIRFRLKSKFPLLPNALAKTTAFPPVIMPERLAKAGLTRTLTEVVGSGPFRYMPGERVYGARTVYERFDGYVPRPGTVTQFTSGPKIAYFDRVEWHVIPDDATAQGALLTGEVDWWERPLIDLLPSLRRAPNVTVDVVDKAGFMSIIRFNQLYPPFDNPAVRRALLGAIDQAELMNVEAGAEAALSTTKVGVFCPESSMASDVGLSVLSGSRDYAKCKAALAAAGYNGEPAVFLTPANNQAMNSLAQVVADEARRAGLNVDLQPVDFGTWLTRSASMEPPAKGGWNCIILFLPGMDLWDPTVHLGIRGTGRVGWSGWPVEPRLEALRTQWLAADDEPARQAISQDIQREVWESVPYIPGGRWRQPTAYRRGLTGVLRGMPIFYNVQG